MPRIALYTVERVGVTQEGGLGTTIVELCLSPAEAVEKCDALKDAEQVAYSSNRLVVEAENPPPEAEIVDD